MSAEFSALSIRATYTNRAMGQSIDLEFAPRDGESFEAHLQRVCTAVRDGLGIEPAPPDDPIEWALLLHRAREGAK